MVNIGINGFGRIGRQIFKIAQRFGDDIKIVALNDIGTPKQMAHLLKYDSMFGTMPNDISYDSDHIIMDGVKYPLFQEKDIKNVDWNGLGVDILIEASGKYAGRVSPSAQDKLPLGGSVKKLLLQRRQRLTIRLLLWASIRMNMIRKNIMLFPAHRARQIVWQLSLNALMKHMG